ncbi:MAG: sodium-dependent transporter [gamma proteobacterium symbiont of Bathyaustriella thionipta]|nr:sodium-dependent transporter [gamma proteobacterium symbiont of Bathyaustriella thionipta]MCU7948974.1 sodium-dependent transporter [gamma proteobacterium symbiont of Bathyaustriella thionipta]MCU7953976.1 sodium-dependent transporter [gamma proteobacterium symbiont of Bathyaustriella thionipta]MCU7955519.1 sodium-dependent transporter [gamma proteobacterium symbiont of Bathyaustriella thionipta]MCU7965700.1 sodium-dependent transporter [gamma proteobacterium symbiont of Bathyaustriella thio
MSDSVSSLNDPSASGKPSATREQWSSRLVFVLAATGSAVGLGNIWKFPYITGEFGGGAFVLIYLMCIASIGIPIMMAEIMLGRRGRHDPVTTMKKLAKESGHSRSWGLLGWMGVIAGFLILSYYSVIASWAMAYVPRMAAGTFSGLDAQAVNSVFSSLVSSPESLIAWHTLFLFMTMSVVARGVRSGLEKAVTYLMPLLFVLLVVLIFYAMGTGHFWQGLSYLFNPDFSKISTEGILSAMGHAFFTLSLGMGAIMVYGSYLPDHTSIAKASISVALMDTLVALLAGMIIFPIVFANSLEPGAGPGLIFKTLPLAFGHMNYGTFFGTLFFVLLVFAAWTSSISLIEPAITWSMKTFQISRIRAAVTSGILVWFMGLFTVFSFNLASEFTISSAISTKYGEFVILKDATAFDFLDYLTSNIMLPLGGLMIAIYAGWLMNKMYSRDELNINRFWYFIWSVLVRYVAPVMVIIVFFNAMGVVAFVRSIMGV